MFATKQFEELAKKLYAVLPENMQNLDSEVQQKFNEILHLAFAKLDLVSREEFDVQVKVLARTLTCTSNSSRLTKSNLAKAKCKISLNFCCTSESKFCMFSGKTAYSFLANSSNCLVANMIFSKFNLKYNK